MKHRSIWVTFAAFLVFTFLFSQDFLARLAWQKYRAPGIALALASQDAELLIKLGHYYFNGGAYNLSLAEQAYKKSLRANPKIILAHYQLARVYFVKGENNLAIEEINKELDINPANLRALYVRGLIYGYRNSPGDLALAEDDFRRFTAWAPTEWAGHNDLAWILEKQGKHEEAKISLLAALEKASNGTQNPWLWNGIGVAELNLKDYSMAKKSFERARELAKNLTLSDWQKAYPGNDPTAYESGIREFQNAIAKNLRKTDSVDNTI